MACCPRISAWWWIKVTLSLGLMIQGVCILGLGWGSPSFVVPLWVGQVVVLCGACFSAAHYAVLKSQTRDLARPETLVTRGGAFRWIRHPMYLGDFVVIVGLGLFCPTWFSAVAIALGALALLRLAQFEDRQMAERFLEPYAEWSRKSRLLIPLVL